MHSFPMKQCYSTLLQTGLVHFIKCLLNAEFINGSASTDGKPHLSEVSANRSEDPLALGLHRSSTISAHLQQDEEEPYPRLLSAALGE